MFLFFFSRRRRHTRCALVTGVQTCALPILTGAAVPIGNFAHPYLGGSSRMSSRLKSRIRTFAGLSSERIASPTQYTFSLGNPRWRKNATHYPYGDMVNSFRRRSGKVAGTISRSCASSSGVTRTVPIGRASGREKGGQYV